MPELDFPQILAQLRQSPFHSTNFSDTWLQGRSAFGGLTGALAVCAMEKILPSPQPIRSLMGSFIAPLPPGEVSVLPKIIRQGKNVTQLSVDVIAKQIVCFQALAVFGNSREALAVNPDPGFNPEPRSDENSINGRPGQLPAFLDHFSGNWTGGGMPFSGSKDLRLGLWARHRADMSAFPIEKILSIADIPPPVILSHYTQPMVPASSLTWSLEFIKDPVTVDEDWFYLDFVIDHADHGYTHQSGKIFTENGELCALSRQCMVYFD